MRIVVDPSTFDCQNMGDVAMLQVAVSRLKELWSSAVIQVFTNEPKSLLLHCPGVSPVLQAGRTNWSSDHYLLGRVHRVIPTATSRRLLGFQRALRRRWPILEDRAIRLRMRLVGERTDVFRAYTEAIDQCDLLFVSGSGGLTDAMPVHSRVVLDTVDRALRRGKPVAIFGQGVGPLDNEDLATRIGKTLRCVEMIALRESYTGLPLLERLGIPMNRVTVTGDDAIELAYNARPKTLGDSIGVNVRLASYANVDENILDPLRAVLHPFARARGISLVPVPIALHSLARDPANIRQIFRGYDDQSNGGIDLTTPQMVIEQVRRCRLVVTGAYHAAVFALAQGIPAVCLCKSAYVRDKFVGLKDQFGDGCQLVDLNDPDYQETTRRAMERAWRSAENLRSGLLKAALRQLLAGQATYRRLKEVIEARPHAA